MAHRRESRRYASGDRVRVPEGIEGTVLACDDDTVTVKLDGEATGIYPLGAVEEA